MTAREVVLRVIQSLDAAGVPYMLVGSFSTNLYGIARSTKDADLVIELGDRSIRPVFEALADGFRADPQATLEMATLTTRYVIHHAASGFKVELFLLSHDAHDQERFRRRLQAPYLGANVWVPTPEDAVITKLRWAVRAKRTKDEQDVLNVLAVQREKLDLGYIRKWCDEHGSRSLLEQLLQKVEELGPR